jgi:hypothetical protein
MTQRSGYQSLVGTYCLHLQGTLYHEDRSNSFLRIVGNHMQDYTESWPRRYQYGGSLITDLQVPILGNKAGKVMVGFLFRGVEVSLSPLGTSATSWPIVPGPRMIEGDNCGADGRLRNGRGNRSTTRKPASMSLCPPQIPHDLTWDRTQATAVRSRGLTAWAMAQPKLWCYFSSVGSRSWSLITVCYTNALPLWW